MTAKETKQCDEPGYRYFPGEHPNVSKEAKHTQGRLYSHKTDGGAEYLCTEHVDGCDEGDLHHAVIRLDGGPVFISSVHAAAQDLLAACKSALTFVKLNLENVSGIKYTGDNLLAKAIAKAEGK